MVHVSLVFQAMGAFLRRLIDSASSSMTPPDFGIVSPGFMTANRFDPSLTKNLMCGFSHLLSGDFFKPWIEQ
jgi:hypothetical protein